MKTTIHLHGKPVTVELSEAALRALEQRSGPLQVEIHLIFGCLIAKRVWFGQQPRPDAVQVTPRLGVSFRTVRYEKSCRFADIDAGAVPSDFPMVANRHNFVPDLVRIDHHAGKWVGDFTYSTDLLRAQARA